MDNEEYLTYQKFNDEGLANELAEKLRFNNFDFIMEDTAPFDVTFSNNELNKEYRIKLKPKDFEKANKLLQTIALKELENVDKDYYLFEFTDEELMEIITKSDEWSNYDYVLALKILKERGKEVKPEQENNLKKERLEELAKPEVSKNSLIIFGFVLSLLGGVISIIIGWHLLYFKKTLPNGDRVYCYSGKDRKHGLHIIMLGVLCFTIWISVSLLFLEMD
jgi:hypothetical protein